MVTIVATPLNSGHEEKAVTVRSHGAEHTVDLLAVRYRQGCRRLLVGVAGGRSCACTTWSTLL